uniref:Potassium channel, subfamily K, member 13b n=1 Tax=Callorhinchus milii TaxID=7868 RepID=A0A4W3HXQ1_CALMI|eukprot:gi/632987808/ref/XP_007882761.1/ PREDICTED: potassium channel subfamily K member 13-like [Callorhinchus milii]
MSTSTDTDMMDESQKQSKLSSFPGFGMTTPATVSGKIFLIFYGLVGCAATILFFNLFLERLVTLLAYILKSLHERQLRRGGLLPQDNSQEPSPMAEVDSLAVWKPSVYYVMLILGVAAILISCCASAMYVLVEGWSYLDSLYFCFVAFSTIGFGDLVSSQKVAYRLQGLYKFGNFIFILIGVCCIYSLFNIISIVIKQFLNWMLRKSGWRFCQGWQRKLFPPRRNAVVPGNEWPRRKISIETDGVNESETDGRRVSGELISMKDFLASNKVSLAIMQKQLSETANGHPRAISNCSRHDNFLGGVGPLAIMNNRLAETSVER